MDFFGGGINWTQIMMIMFSGYPRISLVAEYVLILSNIALQTVAIAYNNWHFFVESVVSNIYCPLFSPRGYWSPGARCTSCCAVTTNPEEWRVAITNIHTTAASPPRTRTTHTDHTPSSPLLCLSPPPCIVKSQKHSVVRAANDNHYTKLLSCRVNPHLMKLHISFSIYTPPNLLVNDSLVE